MYRRGCLRTEKIQLLPRLGDFSRIILRVIQEVAAYLSLPRRIINHPVVSGN